MNIRLDSVCEIGKGVNIKREKGSDDAERVIAHLKFSKLKIDREAMDELCGQPIGWAQASLFDEGGAPIAHMDIALPALSAVVTGKIHGVKDSEHIVLSQADLSGIAFALAKFGAELSGELTWEVAGDEVSDLEPLLGRTCRVVWIIQDDGQKNMFSRAA